jgi:hypothetical protein
LINSVLPREISLLPAKIKNWRETADAGKAQVSERKEASLLPLQRIEPAGAGN